LEHDLRIDADDLEEVVAVEIAERAGRSLQDTTRNPYFKRVHTVKDLVRFFCAQPSHPPNQGLQPTARAFKPATRRG
jgi:hypothetical protein